ncbi:GntR family transcriptional regulator [Streptomyces iconiensis]|uniref:GntR family transcriptional regulator n=1 Tax=Streptomyces iconiensis TaxID=1384038 RepID=A0ABT6ZZ14_9ACTN|nr:GntR family transcriptional regulator [Streptomyces iconiensis]MDJ1134301.1 GntR family transcriptional regulator [Streptomyces iconiensis]
MGIERRPLREQVKDEILELLGQGRLDAGEPINEIQLAEEVGVSRTPLREALISLEREGIITSERGKGFRFAPIGARELRDVTAILISLESLALELSPPEHLATIAPRLLEEARAFSAPQAPHGTIERHDDAWHDLLLSGCPNERLMDMIASLKLTLHRYERVLVPDEEILQRAAEEHELIAQHLQAGRLGEAVVALKANWTGGMNRILERLTPAENV